MTLVWFEIIHRITAFIAEFCILIEMAGETELGGHYSNVSPNKDTTTLYAK